MSANDAEIFDEFISNDDTFSYFAEYFKRKDEMAIQEAEKSVKDTEKAIREAEKAVKETEKAKQKAEEKLNIAIVNLHNSGIDIDVIANNFLMTP